MYAESTNRLPERSPESFTTRLEEIIEQLYKLNGLSNQIDIKLFGNRPIDSNGNVIPVKPPQISIDERLRVIRNGINELGAILSGIEAKI